MRKPELAYRFRDVRRLLGIELTRQACLDVAEGAGARAGVAHDHEGRVLLLPALADIRAARLLADGDEIILAHDAVRLRPLRGARRLDANPGGLAFDRLVRPVRLFRVAERARPLLQQVQDDG